MKAVMILLVFLAVPAAFLILILVVPLVTGLSCGEHVTESLVLDSNLECYTMNGFVIDQSEDVVLDCAGHVIRSLDSADRYESRGVWIYRSKNVTVKNCVFEDWGRTVGFAHWSNEWKNLEETYDPFDTQAVIINNTIISNWMNHVYSWMYHNISVINNRFIGGASEVIYLKDAAGILVENNTFRSSGSPVIRFHYSHEPTNDSIRIINNTFNVSTGEMIDLSGASGAQILRNSRHSFQASLGRLQGDYMNISYNVLGGDSGFTDISNSQKGSIFSNVFNTTSYVISATNSPSWNIQRNNMSRKYPEILSTAIELYSGETVVWENNIHDYGGPVRLKCLCNSNRVYRNNFFVTPGAIGPTDEAISNWNLSTTGNYYDYYDEPSEGCIDNNDDGQCDDPLPILNVQGFHFGAYDYHPFVRPSGWLEDHSHPSSSPVFMKILNLPMFAQNKHGNT